MKILLIAAVLSGAALAQEADDIKDVPFQDLKAGGDANKRYFLIGPKKNEKAPPGGWKLLVIMPGGDGSAEMRPWVTRIYKNCVPAGYLVAQPVSVKWKPDQAIIWPTEKSKVPDMKFTTEEFVESVIKEVATKAKIDRTRVFTFSWSSSGPAAYAISMRPSRLVTGSLVSMAVFVPTQLPPLARAKGHSYFIAHSKEDATCPYRLAEQARDELKKQGAKVEFETYAGPHGFGAGSFDWIRKGVEWLDRNPAPPEWK